MNLTQIRYFLALADTLNFTRAAAACNVTQPALTKSIRKLEEELGGQLVLRERSTSRLTELGLTMVPLLQQTYEAATAARLGAMQFQKQERTRLRIGLGPWVPPGAIAPLIRELDPKFPNLEIAVRQGGTAALNDWLIASEIDVAFTTDAEGLTQRANSWSLFDEHVVVLLHVAHPLAETAPLSETLLESQIIVARSGSVGETDSVTPAMSAPATQVRHLGATEEHVWTLLRAGRGVALSTARRSVPTDIVRRPLDPPRTLDVYLAAIPGRRSNQAITAFLRLARSRDWTTAFP